MPLRITKATDTVEVKNITAVVYGSPGLGKSTLGFTAEKPLLLDFDHGSYRAGNRGDTVQVESWRDVESISAADLIGYKTLVIDTAGRALDSLALDITSVDPKKGNGASLNLQGFGVLKGRYLGWSKLIRSFGLDVVLIAHTDEQRKGDELIVRLDAQGSSKGEIYKTADLMGQLYLTGGKRVLNFSPTDTAFGKNPAQLAPLEVPHFASDPNFLGNVIARVKADLNKQSESQKAASNALTDWKTKIEQAATAEDFNKLIPETQKADDGVRDNVKRLLTSAAKKKGLAFDKKAGAFSQAA